MQLQRQMDVADSEASLVTGSLEHVGRKTATLATSLVFGRFFSFIISAIALIVVARLLGPVNYGVYAIAIATGGFFTTLGDLGVGRSIVKFVSGHYGRGDLPRVRSIMASAFTLLFFTGLAMTAVSVLLAPELARLLLHDVSYAWAMELAALTILPLFMYEITYNALVAFGKGKQLGALIVMQTALQSAVSIALAASGFGATAPIWGLAVSLLACFLVGAWLTAAEIGLKPSDFAIDMKAIRPIVSFAWPLGVSNIASSATTNVSLAVLGMAAATAVVGNYGLTVKIAGVFNVIVISVGLAMLPVFSVASDLKSHSGELGKYYNYSVYLVLLFMVPVLLTVLALSGPFTYTIFGSGYAYAPAYIALMCVGAVLQVVLIYTTNLFISSGEVRRVMKYDIAMMLAQFVLLPLFVFTYTGLGLSVLAFILVPLIGVALYLNSAKRDLGVRLDYGKLARVLASGAVSAALIFPLASALGNAGGVAILVACGLEQVALYPAVVTLLKGINRRDVEIMRRMTSSLPVISNAIEILTGYALLFSRE